MTDEPTARTRIVTRCYLSKDETMFILRTTGQPDDLVAIPEIPGIVVDKLANEAIAKLLLSGATMADIASGKAIPDRTVPADKPIAAPRVLNQNRRAILAVKMADMKKAAKAGGEKLDAVAVATLFDRAETWVRGLTDEQVQKATKAEAVRFELARMTGEKVTLDQLFAEPEVVPVVEAAPETLPEAEAA